MFIGVVSINGPLRAVELLQTAPVRLIIGTPFRILILMGSDHVENPYPQNRQVT